MTDDALLASVIVPTWNRSGFIATCLAALDRQTVPSHMFEVIVVDDGSTDDTQQLLALWQARMPNLRYLIQGHQGPNAARNKGISETNADLVCFLDDDSLPDPDWLRELGNAASRWPLAAAFGGPIVLTCEGKLPRTCGRERLGETELDLGDREHEVNEVYGANMAIRRWAFDKFGMFDATLRIYGDESEWFDRLRDAAAPTVYVPLASVSHRRTPNQLRMLGLVKRRFQRGRNAALNWGETLERGDIIQRSLVFARYFGHALVRRCFSGVLAAATLAGDTTGCVEVGLRRRRYREPGPDALVSVVIATRNRRSLLQEAVASVCSQSDPKWELIIVDDASNDETGTYLRDVRGARIRSFRNEVRCERSVSRNRGLSDASGDVVIFLDDDDMLAPRAIETVREAFSEAPTATAVIGNTVVLDEGGPGDVRANLKPRIRKGVQEPIWRNLDGTRAGNGCVAYRVAALRDVGGFDTMSSVAEEWALLWKLADLGHEWVLVPELLLVNRNHLGSGCRPNDEQLQIARVQTLRSACARTSRAASKRLRAWDYLIEARQASSFGHRRRALRNIANAIALDPTAVRSDLIRRTALTTVVRCAVPSRLVPLARLLSLHRADRIGATWSR